MFKRKVACDVSILHFIDNILSIVTIKNNIDTCSYSEKNIKLTMPERRAIDIDTAILSRSREYP